MSKMTYYYKILSPKNHDSILFILLLKLSFLFFHNFYLFFKIVFYKCSWFDVNFCTYYHLSNQARKEKESKNKFLIKTSIPDKGKGFRGRWRGM